MSALTDLLISQTDPVTALLLIILSYYVRNIDRRLQDEIRRVRDRVDRLEDSRIADSVLAQTDGGNFKSDGREDSTSDGNSEP